MALESLLIAGGIGWAYINEREKAELRDRIDALEDSRRIRTDGGETVSVGGFELNSQHCMSSECPACGHEGDIYHLGQPDGEPVEAWICPECETILHQPLSGGQIGALTVAE